ncbi:MAG: hypothetical protein FGM24_00935 [Candidatus Kapabacteria bacterium]|nr:hypothetical protein [Candidatus Kapabacteria bacterium]
MNIKILVATLCSLVLESWSAQAQSSFFPVSFSTFRHPAPGYYLIAPNSIDSLGFIDHGARNAHAVHARLPAAIRWQVDNTVTYIDAGRGWLKMNVDLEVVDTLRLPDYDTDFHECRTLSNGNTILFGFDPRVMDLSGIVSGGKTNARVEGSLIREVTPQGNTVFQWYILDHTNVTDAVDYYDLTQASIDYAHPNSIAEDLDGNFILSVRHFDAILKINRATGAVMWWLGGEKARRNDFRWINDDNAGFTGFSHQHSVEVMSNGNIVMFDNGNMKANSFSRAVMYQLDQTNMTVTKVWEYRHTPDIFTASMGSVQELPNGNILIGWGTNDTKVIATEVAPDGSVEAELVSDQPQQIRSYRVMKAPFSMTGTQKDVSQPGHIEMDSPDSTSHISFDVTNVTQPTNVIVERHWNVPVSPVFNGPLPCRILPSRWSVRSDRKSTITASMEFTLGNVPGIDDPSSVVLYHRNTDGTGAFSKVQTTYDARSKTLTAGEFKTGEYLTVYESCQIPYPIRPAHKATHLPANDITFAWSVAVQSNGYQLQISTASNFNTTVLDAVIQNAEAYTYRLLNSYTTYYWRVRTRLENGQTGQWSEVRSFRTRLDAPGPLSPRISVDTAAVLPTQTFSWTKVGNANSYHVRLFIHGAADSLITEDTLQTNGWLAPALQPNSWYVWDVRALADTAASLFSARAAFLTSPDKPTLEMPDDSLRNAPYRDVRLAWSAVDQATRYRVRVTIGTHDSVTVDTIIESTILVLGDLTPGMRYRWSACAIGRYGVGPWATERVLWTAELGTLAAATPVMPRNGDTVLRDSVILSWSQPDAVQWVVQLGSSASMDDILYEVSNYQERTLVVPASVLAEGREYFWRVKGFAGSLESDFSAVRRFVIAVAPPPVVIGLVPLEPLSGAIDVPRSGVFRWTSDSRVDTYSVLLYRGLQTSPERTLTTSDTVAPYAGLEAGTAYRWCVRGRKDGITVDTGAIATFTTEKVEVVSVVDIDVEAASSGLLRGKVACDGSTVNITLTDLQGRLVERAEVSAVNGAWSYLPRRSGLLFATVSACGNNSTVVLMTR